MKQKERSAKAKAAQTKNGRKAILSTVAIKHLAVLNRLVENTRKNGTGRVSMKQAMQDEGYSENYANQAGITRSISYPDLLKKVIPDAEMVREHYNLLHAAEIERVTFPSSVPDESIKEILAAFNFPVIRIMLDGKTKSVVFAIMNARAKKDALDMAYKIKKLYTNGTNIEIGGKYGGFNQTQLAHEVAERTIGLLRGGRREATGGR